MFKTPIYGSGKGENNLPAGKPAMPMAPIPDPLSFINAIFFEFPVRLMKSFTQPFHPTPPEGMEPRVTRKHTPHGEVVQEMTTIDLKNKNIFGTGGSQ